MRTAHAPGPGYSPLVLLQGKGDGLRTHMALAMSEAPRCVGGANHNSLSTNPQPIESWTLLSHVKDDAGKPQYGWLTATLTSTLAAQERQNSLGKSAVESQSERLFLEISNCSSSTIGEPKAQF